MPAPPLPNTAVAELAKGVAGGLIQPGDADFDQARRVWNGMIDRRPALIVRCAGADDVKAAVKFARKHEQLVAVRGGGHSVAGHGTCDGGLVVDLSPMREVHVDPQKRRASIQAGATWRDLDRASQAHRLAVTGGIVSETGVAGLTLGGGIGWLMRKHGLTADNLAGADLVTADGQFLHASAEQNAELFWGLQRGGGNFGIVTELRFRLHPVGPIVLAGWVLHPQDKATEVLRFYRNYAAAAPEELTTIVILRRLPHLPKLPPFLRGMPIIGVAVCHAGVIEAGERMVQPLRAFGPPLVDGISLKPYVEHQTMFDAAQPPGRHNYWKTSYLRELSDAAIDAIVDSTRRMTSPLSLLALYQLGGAARLGEAAFCLNVAATWIDPAEREAHIAWARESWAAIAPHATAGAYVNFLGDEGQERTQAAYRQDYERLVALKNTYDPRNFFRLNQNIQPTVV
ncbi:MAG: FAD-linked oxidase [Betaproteobacteria bacterium RIFCSPLOWO2_12_FULL_68_19]|nr:MAG: FAD-linked oxidase [Betaproteobacteria bacterium RIFCSPLOWO2_12_FULL_68_19]